MKGGKKAVRYGSSGSTGVRIGVAEYLIREVLDQLVEGSEKVSKVVQEFLAQEAQNHREKFSLKLLFF